MQENVKCLDLGTRIGRGQAFGLVAAHSLLAQAQSLLDIRDSQAHKMFGLTWEEFCPRFIGLSRPRVDNLIHNLEEFGAAYFQLSEIVKLSPEAYRQIAPRIQQEAIEIDGELVPIVAENAQRIREEIQRVRGDRKQATRQAVAATPPGICSLQIRLDACFAEMRRMIDHLPMHMESAPALNALCVYGVNHLNGIQADLAGRLE